MEKTKDAVKCELKKQYDCACNQYVSEFGDDVGGIYDYDGGFTISMENIIYCVEHDITGEQYLEWQDYTIEASEFNMEAPNFRSWMMGCPRTSPGTFERLRGLKAELQKAVDEEKDRQKNIF